MPGYGKKRRLKPLSSSATIILSFSAIILLGAILLTLPAATKDGVRTPFINALFTAVSATCVTGLITYDTAVYWSLFGQLVIIVMIQTGGLGFMTMATMLSRLIRRNISFSERLTVSQSLGIGEGKNFFSLFRNVIMGTLLFEGCGAAVLSIRFIADFGFFGGLYRGIFTSISAFCNAGFDLCGTITPLGSLAPYRSDLSVNLTVCALIVLGGLGFTVWTEISSGKPIKSYSTYTKVVLSATAVLLVFGAAAFALSEYINPVSAEGYTVKEKILAALFNSATLRTAGFATVDYGSLKELTLIVCILLMFIGGSTGSTAGGVKVTTVSVLFFAVVSVFKGSSRVVVNKQKIANETILRAFTLFTLSVSIILVFTFAIALIEGLAFLPVLFECVSAFCTVGLTMGITVSLSPVSLVLLSALMFLGRVGLFTVAVSLFVRAQRRSELFDYPETRFMIG